MLRFSRNQESSQGVVRVVQNQGPPKTCSVTSQVESRVMEVKACIYMVPPRQASTSRVRIFMPARFPPGGSSDGLLAGTRSYDFPHPSRPT